MKNLMPNSKKYYTVMLDLTDTPVLIIGGGKVALRKTQELLKCNAKLTIISDKFISNFENLAAENKKNVKLIKRKYAEGDIDKAKLVFCATNDPQTNKAVFAEANRLNIFINSADDLANCSFILPSVIRKENLIIAVSTGGASPAYASKFKTEISKIIPDNIENLLDALSALRRRLKETKSFSTAEKRAEFLKTITNDQILSDQLITAHLENNLENFIENHRTTLFI
jgi:siroheme synthase-like protein